MPQVDVPAPMATRPRPSLAMAAGLLAALILGGATAFHVRREQVIEARQEKSRELVEEIARDLERRLTASREEAVFFASLEVTRAAIGSSERRLELEHAFEAFLAARPGILQARLLDLEGREVVRVERQVDRAVPVAELQDKSDRYYFAAARQLRPGEVHVSRLDLNVEHGRVEIPPRPVVRFSTVVAAAGGEPVAVLVLNEDAHVVLSAIEQWSGRVPGKLVLVDVDGAYLSHPDVSRLFGGKTMLATGEGLARDDPELASWINRSTSNERVFRGGDLLAARAAVTGLDGAPQVLMEIDASRAVAEAAPEFFSLAGWMIAAFAFSTFLVIVRWRRELAIFDRNIALARAKSATLTEAAAALAHEVKNPLAAIVSSVGQLKAERSSTPMDRDSVRLMEIVLSESARLARTLDDFMDLARPQAAREASIDLKSLAEDVTALARRDPLFEGRVELAVEGSSFRVQADPDQLRQVLWNLVLNAGAASRKAGGSAVKVRVLERQLGHGSSAIIEVVDDGPGPPVLGSDRAAPARGGLGLIVASGIVARHGGQLELRPNSGERRGTCAVVTLPLFGGRA
jgi:signal transduction histidine kinase